MPTSRAGMPLPHWKVRQVVLIDSVLHRMSAAPVKPFSMIREFHLADWFTLGNAVCGTGALFSAMSYIETGATKHIYYACALVLAALAFDVLDGRIARWRQAASSLGRELDSLADVISFGVAPAIIACRGFLTGLCWRALWPAACRAWRATT